MKKLVCLGIESTAHNFGIGIVDSQGKILSNIKDSYTTKSGGIIPTEAAKHHERVKEKVLSEALKKAKIKLSDINLIAFSQGPGLAPCLLQGMRLAKKLANELKKPLVPVNHCIAHLEIGKLLTKAKDPVLLYVSGGNTQIIAYASGKYRIFGETLDIGVGNFIDSFARHIGLGFPGGPKISEIAKKSNKFIELPYSVKGMDVAFSGLLTNLKQKYDRKNKVEDLAYSLQEVSFAMLVEVSERAMAHLNKKELLLGGGVACNSRLQEMCRVMCKERQSKSYCQPTDVLVDNAAMIAWLGILMFKSGQKVSVGKISSADIKPFERTDDVRIGWL